ncbi:hypothetical protein BD410DRAFT_811779 [Rickenella mellea]|uniref:RlpA-like protein double-psi beta-barrel domain-containing protein n=1 Tax=Rickenella mellea TaxID=50990 RepID=A0A4Y7QP94_9AGAM|nr:hypothetical protein BD410DRAFT_811779 [Rickenella mellea]
MFSLPTILAVLSVAASVSSLTTPHHLRTVHHRRALAARAPSPIADAAPLDSAQVVRTRKRRSGGRCKPAPSSSSKAPSAATPAPAANAGTFYGIGLGSCGWTNGGDDLIAAVSWKLYDSFPGYQGGNPNNNPVCGRKVTAHYNGKSTQVTIVDRCTGCAETDLDFSPAAFNQLADFALGRIHGVKWNWD